ncbi:hypothetical protein ACFVVM_33930 [Nocardia sp. NPDC058176]|uniref:nSTAND1 domain-containing NTPase n=1 Tax=Nocardia sp. NPDC058176 TaxID=3346368 RepID=UPI0036DDEF64
MHVEDGEKLSPRAVFARRFAELYALAGNPTLRRVATATERRMRGTGTSTASPQRISDWKAGRNVPARFESLLPVILTLVELAEKAQRTVPRGLADPHAWQQRWQASVTWTADSEEESACPYPGLRAYRTEERALFFGRDRVTAEFAALVTDASGIVILIGASGAGKSSLLAAGLVPTLDRPTTTITPGTHPGARLTDAMAAGSRVLVVDQFEELFTLCTDDADRDEFLTTLANLATRTEEPLTVVLALRADFYERCLHYAVLQDALQHRGYLLGPMRMDEVSRALTGPLAATGLTLEPGLEELVIAELRGLDGHPETAGYDPGALPLLSHVMAATWQQREGRRLTVGGYRKAGGVAGSVAATAELAWGELTDAQQHAARELLGALVTVGRDSRDTRRTVGRAELVARGGDPAAATEVLEVLAATRLIALDADSVQLSHEIVLTAWPRLRGWIDTDRVGYLVRQRLESDAAEWTATDRDSALLYRGTRLDSANEHADRTSPLVREFLDASGRSARRGARWRVGAGVVVVALLATGLVAVDRGRLADQRAADRDYAELVAAAQRTRAGDPSLSAQLSLAAYRMRPDEATRTQLLNTQELPLAVTVPAHEQGVRTLADRPADNLLVSLDYLGNTVFWNIEDPARPRRLDTDLGVRTTRFVFVPGGTDAITDGPAGIQRWDLARPESPVLLHTFGTGLRQVIAVSPDGDQLAEVYSSELTLWRIGDRSRPTRAAVIQLPGDNQQRHIEFGPDGDLLAVGHANFDENEPDTVQLWDVRDPDRPRPSGAAITIGRGETLRTLAFSPDGTTLATGISGSSDLTVATSSRVDLWQITDPRAPRRFGAPIRVDNDVLNSITFHEGGQVLATGSYGAARLWNITDPALPVQAGPDLSVSSGPCPQNPFAPCQGGPLSMVFRTGEPMLATGGDDGALRIWTMPRSMLDKVSGVDGPPVFDRTGHRMAMLHAQGAVTVWDTSEPARPVRLSTVPGSRGRSDPALSPDGRTLSIHDGPGNQRIVFDLDNPRDPRPLTSWPTGTARRSVVEGNRMLLVEESSAQMWDVTDRTAPTPLGRAITANAAMAYTHEFSADGTRVEVRLLDENRSARQIWNLDDPRDPRSITETDVDPVLAIQPSLFLADNRTLAVAQSNYLELWDPGVSDPSTSSTNKIHTEIAPIMAISTARDGAALAVTSDDGTTALWDVRDPRAPRRLSGSIGPADGQPRHAVLHPGGEHLVVITYDGHLGVWDLDPDRVADQICAATGDLLTEPVWRRQLPNLPYRPPCA